jgi:hypothetical protein
MVINKTILFLCNLNIKVTKNAKIRDNAEQLQFPPFFTGLYCNNLEMIAAHGTLQKELRHKVS